MQSYKEKEEFINVGELNYWLANQTHKKNKIKQIITQMSCMTVNENKYRLSTFNYLIDVTCALSVYVCTEKKNPMSYVAAGPPMVNCHILNTNYYYLHLLVIENGILAPTYRRRHLLLPPLEANFLMLAAHGKSLRLV